ncbi:LEA type 2 family protein [Aquipseudomonas campi]
MPLLRLALAMLLASTLFGCSSFALRDPVRIDLVGLEPLAGQGLEVRFAAKLRVQNPNDQAITYNGVALELDINGQPLARGVSDQGGEVPRFGEAVISVPISISAFSVVRQAWGAAGHPPGQSIPYVLRGKLASGLFGTTRFSDSGTLDWPQPLEGPYAP